MSQHGNKKRSCTGKRILSILIALIMLIGILPVGAMGAGENAGDPSNASETIRYSVLILDASGSMSGTPAAKQKQAAIKFCESILNAEGDNYVAIVVLDNPSFVGLEFTNNADTLKSYINSILANGGTNINQALEKADELLADVNIEKAIKNIILCSDGLPQSGKSSASGRYTSADHSNYRYANAVYDTAAILNTTTPYNLYTLGFFHKLTGNDLEFGARFMDDIQNAGFYIIEDPEELEFGFGEIAGDIISGGKKETNVSFTLMPGFDGGHCYEWDFKYSDSYFDKLSSEYYLPLAKVSLGLACAAGSYNCDGNIASHKHEARDIDWSVIKALKEMGFAKEDDNDIRIEGYREYGIGHWLENGQPKQRPIFGEEDSIGSAFAIKTLEDGTPLIVVAVRGGGYDNEWIGNFEVGPTVIVNDSTGNFEYHLNFLQSALKVLSRLNNYLEGRKANKEYSDLSNAKIWITGYSRGAAVANIAAHLLKENRVTTDKAVEIDTGSANTFSFPHLGFAENQIFAYTFATPAGAKSSNLIIAKKTSLADILKNTYVVGSSSMIKPDMSLYDANIAGNKARITSMATEYFLKRGENYTAFEISQENGAIYVTPIGKVNPSSIDKYIHNTVGYSDFVPMVMMKEWGYERFGQTHVLPSARTEKAVFSYNYSSLSATYSEIMKKSGRENQWDSAYEANDNRHDVYTAALKFLARNISADKYYKEYQDDIMTVVQDSLGKKEHPYCLMPTELPEKIKNLLIFGPVLDTIWTGIWDYPQPYFLAVAHLFHKAIDDGIIREIPRFLGKGYVKLGLLDAEELDALDAINRLDMSSLDSFDESDIAGALARDESLDDIVISLLEGIVDDNCEDFYGGEHLDKHKLAEMLWETAKDYFNLDNLDGLLGYYFYDNEEEGRVEIKLAPYAAQEHYPEVYMSRLLNMGNYYSSTINYGSIVGAAGAQASKVIRIACPTDVYVYDGSGSCVASIVNNVVSGDKLYATVNDQNEKTVYIPYDSNIRAKIVATDEGTMDVAVTEYEDEYTMDVIQRVMYFDLPLAMEQEYSLGVEGGYRGDVTVTTNGDTVVPTVTMNGDISEHLVCVTFDANDGSERYTTIFTDGYGKIPNLPIPERSGREFFGWYTKPVGGTEITADSVFLEDFTVYAHWDNGNSEHTGQYTPKEPTAYPIIVEASADGNVTVNYTPAAKDTQISVVVTPNKGYETDTVSVTDKNGEEIALTKNSDGTYGFIMPESKVTLTATFRAKAHDCPSAHLKDMDPNAWYHEYVDYVVENGLMQGTAADKFAPNATTTRAMIVTILYRLEGQPAVSGTSPFDDVTAGQWYADAVIWANANGIVEGYGNGRFGTTDNITREQFAAILYRYAKLKGYDVSKSADISGYADASAVSAWAVDAMKWANAENLITGRTSTTLVPKGEATRAEAAAILMRFIER